MLASHICPVPSGLNTVRTGSSGVPKEMIWKPKEPSEPTFMENAAKS